MRILAFSDWRTQDFDILEDAIKNIDPKLDVIVYAGDDVARFEDMSLDNLLRRLEHSGGLQDAKLSEIKEGSCLIIDYRFFGHDLIVMPIIGDMNEEQIIEKLKNCLLYYRKIGEITNFSFTMPEPMPNDYAYYNIRNLSNLMNRLDSEDYKKDMISRILEDFDLKVVEIDSEKYGIFHSSLEESSTNFFQELAKYSNNGVLAVIGNDDRYWCKCILEKDNIYDLHEKPISIGKYTFVGIEGSSSDTNQQIGEILYSEREIKEHLELQAKNVKGKIILISHMPPYKILDFATRFGPENIGSKSIKKFIKNNEVILNICGHVHLFGGQSDNFENCLVVNASSDEGYIYGNVAIIDINEETNKINLEWLDLRNYNLMGLYQVGPVRWGQLWDLGIKTLDNIIEVDKSLLVKNFGKKLTEMWIKHSKALKYDEMYFLEPLKLSNEFIFYDIETTILSYDDQTWLIGAYDSVDNEFRQFIAKDPDEEEKIIKEFLEFIEKKPSRTLCCYSRNYFDKNTLLSRMELFDEKMAELFDKRNHIDLGVKLRKCTILPTYSYGLKDVGTYLGYEWKQSSIDGLIAGTLYTEYIINHDEEPPWEDLLEYNADDVMAMPFIINKLYDLQKEITDSNKS